MMTPPSPLRLAIAQIPMAWELDDNLHAMLRALRLAHAQGARLCAFSELALTGFHRRIAEGAQPQRLAPAQAQLHALAAELGVALAYGVPTFGADGERFNSHLFVEANGEPAGVVSKNGLTAPEATFFQRGHTRPVFMFCGLRCTAVICREIEDFEPVTRQLAGSGVQLILWPGQMRPDPAKTVVDPPEHVQDALRLAPATGAFIVQTNWPNALNRPQESRFTGHSACVSPTGELLFRLPREGFGVGVFTLGEAAVRWLPWPDDPTAAACILGTP